MKALMFGWEFPPHISGGLGTACYGITKSLAKQDVEVLFVMPRAMGDEDASAVKIINASDIDMPSTSGFVESFWSNVQFLPIDSGLIPYLGWEEYSYITNRSEGSDKKFFSHLGGKFTFSGKYGSNLMEEVMRYAYIASKISREQSFDVIHAHDWLTYLAGIVAKEITGKPLIIHVHATEFDRSGENVNRIVYDLERMGMEKADAIITVSNLTRNILINRYGIDKNKVFTIHNAVDFSGKNSIIESKILDEKIVTFLGRITYQKGPEYFIEAAHKVLKVCPNVRFVMAGNGDMVNKMIAYVAKLQIGTRFSFTGFLTGNDVNKMYRQSDVYIMPSVSEPFGISPLEAMREGVPTIISNQSGVAEVLKYTIKVNFWDIDALANAIYGLITYPVLSETLSGKGTTEVNSMNWDNCASKIKNIYQELL